MLGLSFGVIYNLYTNFITPSMASKRVAILIFTVNIWFVLLYVSTKLNKVPRVVLTNSKLSFGIYLLHPFYTRIINKNSDHFMFPNLYIHALFLFIVAVLASGLTTYLLAKTKVGQYFVGSVGNIYKKNSKDKSNPVYEAKRSFSA